MNTELNNNNEIQSLPLEFLEMMLGWASHNSISEAHRILQESGKDILGKCIFWVNSAVENGLTIDLYSQCLRKCHDEGWYLHKHGNIQAKEKAVFQSLLEEIKSNLPQKQKQSKRTLAEKHQIVNHIKAEEPWNYCVLESQAMKNLRLNHILPGRGSGMKIKAEIFRLLDL